MYSDKKGKFRPLEKIYDFVFDPVSDDLVTIDHVHGELHEGNHYIAHDYATNNTTHDVLLISPDTSKRIHLSFEVVSSSTALFQVFAEVLATAGSEIIAYNNDRNNSNTSTLSLSSTPTSVTPGTKILFTGILAAGNKIATLNRTEWEIILKKNTKYLFRVTAAPAVDTVMRFSWYEI